MKLKIAMMMALVLSMSGCASMRKIEVGSGTAASYTVNVQNTHSSTLTVSYTDAGGKTHELGSVSPSETLPFVIPGSSGTTVTLVGVSTAGGHYTGSATLGSTTKVSL